MDFTVEQAPPQNAEAPNYLLAFGTGILAAIVVAPIHRLFVVLFYNGENFHYLSTVVILVGVVTGLMMRWAGGGQADPILAVLAGFVALFGCLMTAYLTYHFIANLYRVAEGLDKALLIQSPQITLLLLIEYFSLNTYPLFMSVASIGVAVYLCAKEDIWGGVRWSPDAGKRGLPSLGSKAGQSQARTAYDKPAVAGIKVPEDAYDLGRPVREYGPALWKLGGIALLTTALALFLIVGLMTNLDEGDTLWVVIVMLVPFAGFAIYRLVMLFVCLNHHVIVFEDGVSISQRGKKYLFRWDEIDRVYHNKMVHQQGVIPITYAHFYKLCHRDGTEVILRQQYEKFNELGSTIHQAVTESQIPKAIETLKKGMPLDFGTMHITREGIHFHDKKKSRMPWEEVGQATVWQGTIRVSSKRRGFAGHSVSMSKTSNPHLFFTFVEKATAPKRQPGGQ